MAVSDSAACEIVRRNFDRYAVAFEDTDAKSPEFSGNGRENLGSVIERDTERGTGKDLSNCPFELD